MRWNSGLDIFGRLLLPIIRDGIIMGTFASAPEVMAVGSYDG